MIDVDKTRQGASPVIQRATLAVGNVFSGVKNAAIDRLRFTVQNHNGIPNTIAQGRAPVPVATASNEMAATVTDFDPKPGRQPRMGMHMQIHNTPGARVDAVSDAIQRYLNIKPRREPTSDPKAEDSIARHPQGIIQGASRWNDASLYQFSINGAKSVQFQPEIHRWGGSLSAEVAEPGLTGIAAPATRQAQPGPRDVPGQNTADLVFAAQRTMRELAPDGRAMPPLPKVNPGVAFAAQNAMRSLQENLEKPEVEIISVGRGGYSDQPGNQPTVAYKAAIERGRDNLLRGGAAIVEDYEEPASALQKAVNANMATMAGPEKPEIITVGAGDMFQSIHKQPSQAGISGTHSAVNLIAVPGTNLGDARATALNQAYKRAFHIMRQDENFRLATHVVGRRA